MKRKLNRKKILLLIIIVTFILLILLINLYELIKDKQIDISEGENFFETYAKDEDGKVTRRAYTEVNSCISTYINSLKTDAQFYDEENAKLTTYNLLSQRFIDSNGITVDNVYNYVETLDGNFTFVPLEIKIIQDSDIKSFLVHVILEYSNNFEKYKEFCIIVNIDLNIGTFSVEPLYGFKNFDKINEKEYLETKINKNNYNGILPINARGEDIVEDYLKLYKELTLGAPEEMYKLLDKSTKNSTFKSLESFKEYVEENRDVIYGLRVEECSFPQSSEESQYVCVDQHGNKYTFNEKNVLNYTVSIDFN